jgi:hypothetical protein
MIITYAFSICFNSGHISGPFGNFDELEECEESATKLSKMTTGISNIKYFKRVSIYEEVRKSLVNKIVKAATK